MKLTHLITPVLIGLLGMPVLAQTAPAPERKQERKQDGTGEGTQARQRKRDGSCGNTTPGTCTGTGTGRGARAGAARGIAPTAASPTQTPSRARWMRIVFKTPAGYHQRPAEGSRPALRICHPAGPALGCGHAQEGYL